MRELVFVHGRAQQQKDAVALKREWVAAWDAGLAKSGLRRAIPEDRIRFPYYGDTLHDLVRGVAPDRVAEIVVRGAGAAPNPEERRAIVVHLDEARRRLGVSDAEVQAEAEAALRARGEPVVVERGPQNWGWVQALLSVIDRRVPGGSAASIALVTRDVFKYLTNPGLRDIIESGVRQAMTPGVESVVVGHSLGSVVAYNLLQRDGATLGWRVPLFVTVGSPLAVTDIRVRVGPPRHPACAGAWFNAMDPDDVVSLYPLDERHFPGVRPPIENKTDVDNRTPNQHGIAGYLSDADVARRIHDAL